MPEKTENDNYYLLVCVDGKDRCRLVKLERILQTALFLDIATSKMNTLLML